MQHHGDLTSVFDLLQKVVLDDLADLVPVALRSSDEPVLELLVD